MANTTSANANANTKRKCVVCSKEFDLMEYAIHIYEEQLQQLIAINLSLGEIKEYTEFTYQMMMAEEEMNDRRIEENIDDVSEVEELEVEEDVNIDAVNILETSKNKNGADTVVEVGETPPERGDVTPVSNITTPAISAEPAAIAIRANAEVKLAIVDKVVDKVDRIKHTLLPDDLFNTVINNIAVAKATTN